MMLIIFREKPFDQAVCHTYSSTQDYTEELVEKYTEDLTKNASTQDYTEECVEEYSENLQGIHQHKITLKNLSKNTVKT